MFLTDSNVRFLSRVAVEDITGLEFHAYEKGTTGCSISFRTRRGIPKVPHFKGCAIRAWFPAAPAGSTASYAFSPLEVVLHSTNPSPSEVTFAQNSSSDSADRTSGQVNSDVMNITQLIVRANYADVHLRGISVHHSDTESGT